MSTRPPENRTAKLGLGTAQLGMRYGVANQTGQPSAREAGRILASALQNGISFFDTAQGYGQSEALLGEFLADEPRARIATKIAPPLHPDHPERTRRETRDTVAISSRKLRRQTVPIVFLHRATDLSFGGGAVVKELTFLQQEGLLDSLGLSVYTPREAWLALDDGRFDILEIPINLLDARFANEGVFEEAAKNGVEIVGRSVFLQGLLLMGPKTTPAHLAGARPTLAALSELSESVDLPMTELALRHAIGQSHLDIVLVGAETADQVIENARIAARGPLPSGISRELEIIVESAPTWMVDPRQWPPS